MKIKQGESVAYRKWVRSALKNAHEIVCRIHENATWVRGVTKLDKIRSERIRGKRKVGEIAKKVQENGCSGRACHRKKGALRRRETDGN